MSELRRPLRRWKDGDSGYDGAETYHAEYSLAWRKERTGSIRSSEGSEKCLRLPSLNLPPWQTHVSRPARFQRVSLVDNPDDLQTKSWPFFVLELTRPPSGSAERTYAQNLTNPVGIQPSRPSDLRREDSQTRSLPLHQKSWSRDGNPSIWDLGCVTARCTRKGNRFGCQESIVHTTSLSSDL